MQEMTTLSLHRGIKPSAVVFDGWYASIKNLKFLTKNNLFFVTVLSGNRIVDFGEHIADKEIPESH